MLKCHIVRDLLPLYVDDLVSEETGKDLQQHLAGCAECAAEYQQLLQPIEKETVQVETNEIDFLKKVKQKMTKRVLSILVVTAVLLLGGIYFYGFGQPLASDEVTVTKRNDQGELALDFSAPTTSGFLKVTSKIIPDEQGGFTVELTPKKLWKLPFDDVGEGGFSWGWQINEDHQEQVTVVLKFKDQEVVLNQSDF